MDARRATARASCRCCRCTMRLMLGDVARAGRIDRAARREAVKLEVPMRVDLKYGRSWGDASHTWEELTGDSAPIKSAPTATVVPIKTVSAVPPKPAIVVPPGPAIVIPLPPRAPAATAAAATSPPAPPPPIDATDIQTEIDLADLVDCRVPGTGQPHGAVPVPRRNQAEHAYLPRPLLLLRLRRVRRPY